MTDKPPERDRHKMFRALFSVDEDDWDRFGSAAGKGLRPNVLRAFVAWYIRKPGAKLPERPPRQD